MSKASTAKKKSVSPWAWFINLALAAAFLYFLYFLEGVPETGSTTPPQPGNAQTEKGADELAKPESKHEEPRFTFYDILPETEVVAPKVDAYIPKKPPENVSYLVQTGSFRRYEDAERQKAQIAFQGLKAQIAKVEVESDNIWYRVQVGPYKSRSRMNSAIDKLVSINIQPLVKKQVAAQ